ncbi:hypothetical protein [Streptomyces sp.]|uniref:hypothetical protein n=1 Tax=Streptomyces sp. TaxID=1931 RepID=UPI002D8027BC|nr:hypothetical protein [Streptomyces sp.]
MRRRIAAVLAAGAAGLLTVAVPTSAQAATGTFYYVNAYTKLGVTVTNPADGRCIQTPASGRVANNTSSDATLYPTPACQGEPLGTLAPRGTASGLSFGSVIFAAP